MSCKLVYEDIAPGAAADASVSSPDAMNISSPAILPTGESVPKIATLEHDMWGLDGEYQTYTNQNIPFWSDIMSKDDGCFTEAPTIIIEFDNQYTSLGLFLRFAPQTEDYCSLVTISWYQGATLLSQKVFMPDRASYFCANTVTAYNKLVIELNKTNKPYRYARLEQIVFGIVREFNADEIENVRILQQINLLSAELAINTLDWKLRSTDDVQYVFQLKQPVKAYNGESLVGVFYIAQSKRLGNRIYEVSCQDALGVLDASDFEGGMYSGKNAAEIINEIIGTDF